MSSSPSVKNTRSEMEKDRLNRQLHQRSTTQAKFERLTTVQLYILVYNLVSASLWGYILFLTVSFLSRTQASATTSSATSYLSAFFTPSSTPVLSSFPNSVQNLVHRLEGLYEYRSVGQLVRRTQSLAVLEVAFSLIGWVRSPLGTTAAQVYSRLWTVWGVVEAVPETHSSLLFTTMIFAWSFTEVIRYSYYALSAFGIEANALQWLRYTTFIPLYPFGAASEALLSFSTLPPLSTLPLLPSSISALSPAGYIISRLPLSVGKAFLKTAMGRSLLWNIAKASAVKSKVVPRRWGWVEMGRLVNFLIWWPSLFVLMGHMFKQRRRVLGKGQKVGQKVKVT